VTNLAGSSQQVSMEIVNTSIEVMLKSIAAGQSPQGITWVTLQMGYCKKRNRPVELGENEEICVVALWTCCDCCSVAAGFDSGFRDGMGLDLVVTLSSLFKGC
jgi:hypothetical protein